ncbi:MAG: fibronectin type III domain-containing protein [Bacteroidetes bacterium]|nr:fibronectin type III domain-containing protein [Bacteroidota bacterium]
MKTLNRSQRRMSWKRFNKQAKSRIAKKPVSLIGILFQMVVIILTIYAAKIGLTGTTPLQLLERWRTVIVKMTGNPNFATTIPSLADQTLMCDALEVAIQNAESGDHDKIALRDEIFDDAKDMFRLVVYYVTQIAQGNSEIIRSAGLAVKQGRGPSQIPAQVQNVKAAYYGVAKIKLLWRSVGTHPHYNIEKTTDPINGPWQFVDIGTFRTRYVVEDLTPGVEYFFRISADNSLGQGFVSEVANFRCG